MTAPAPHRPSQFMLVLFWLLLIVVYGGVTQLPAVWQSEEDQNGGGKPFISDQGEVPQVALRPLMHIMIADREDNGVHLEEMIRLEGTLNLTSDVDTILSQKAQFSVGRQLGQFFQNNTLNRLYLDLSPTTATYISEYRSWSNMTFLLALTALIIGFLWLIIVQTLVEKGGIDSKHQESLWRWSTLIALVGVAALHSMMVYYQGGVLVSPVGLVATAIVPLLMVQIVVLWEGKSKSWPLFLPLLALIAGHWWAQLAAARQIDPATVAVLSDLFNARYLYQAVYIFGVGIGILSIAGRRPSPTPKGT